MQMIFPTSTTATIGHTARPNAAGTHFERARHRCRAGCSRDLGNLEQAETKADCFRSRQGAQNPLAERCRSVQTALLPLATSETDA